MKTFKKIIAFTLAIAMVAAVSVGATVAYLQDEDSDVNVMTLGNVQIAQHEYERVVDENGEFKTVDTSDVDPNYGYTTAYELQKFTQGKPAYPAVYTNGDMDWDEFQQLWNQVGAPGSNDLFDDSMKNVVDKFVFVENTGKSDAYYRTIVAIEVPEGLADGMIHTSFNANSRFDYNSDLDGVQNSADADEFYTTIDGVRYLVYTATYTEVLEPKEVSRPSLLQVYLDPAAENDDVAKFGDTWDILVLSQAVQTAGFDNAQTALDTAFGKVADKAVEWFSGEEFTVPTVVTTEEELEAAVAAGGDIVLGADVATEKSMGVCKATTINLNGFSIKSTEKDTVGDGVFYVGSGGELTINGEGTIDGVGGSEWAMAVWADGGKVTINGGYYTNVGATGGNTSQYDLIYAKNGGEVVINGGKFESQTPRYTLNTHQSKPGTIIVKGGTFVGVDPSNNSADGAGTNYVADGYIAVENDGVWTVVAE